MWEKKRLYGVWIIIKMKTMFELIEIIFVFVGILIILFIINVLFWVGYNDSKTPNINDDYYALKRKPKKDDEGKEV